MKPKNPVFRSLLAISITLGVCVGMSSAQTTSIYTREGTNSTWSNASNWDTPSFPDAPDALAQFSQSVDTDRINMLMSSTLLSIPNVHQTAGILVTDGFVANPVPDGNFLFRNSSTTQTGALRLHGFATTINGDSATGLVANFSDQDISFSTANTSFQLDLRASGHFHVEKPGVQTRVIVGITEGEGSRTITKTGAGILHFGAQSQNSDFTGGLVLREGIVQWTNSGGSGASPFGSGTGGATLTLRGGNLRSTTGTGRITYVSVVFDGDVELGSLDPANNGGINMASSGGQFSTTVASDSVLTIHNTTTLQHATSGPGSITKAGAGTLRLTGFGGALAHTGSTTVSEGALEVQDAAFTSSNMVVASGAILSGQLDMGGVLTMESGSTLSLGLREENSDFVIVRKGADIGGAGAVDLQLTLDFVPETDDVFLLVDNQGINPLDAITGTLTWDGAPLNDGDLIEVNGIEFEYSDQFNGDSLALTVVSDVVPTQNTYAWDGGYAEGGFSITAPENHADWDPELDASQFAVGTANTFVFSSSGSVIPADEDGRYLITLDDSIRLGEMVFDDTAGDFPPVLNILANASGTTAREMWFPLVDSTAITLSDTVATTVRFGGQNGNLGFRWPNSGTMTLHVGNADGVLDLSPLVNGTSFSGVGRGGIHAGSTVQAADRARLLKTGPGTLDLRVADGQGSRLKGTTIEGGTVIIGKPADIGWVPAVETEDHVVINGGTLVFDGLTANLGITRGFMIGDGGATLVAINQPNAISGIIKDMPGQTGSIIKTGDTALRLGNLNEYTGGTIIREGVLRYSTPQSFGFGPVVIEEGAGISAFSGGVNLDSEILIDGDTVNFGGDGFVMYFDGNIDLGGEIRTINFLNSAVFNGDIDNGGLILQANTNAQRIEFDQVNSYDGPTTIHRGNLMVNQSTASNVTVSRGVTDPEAIGSIGGVGEVIGDVMVSGAIKPGALPLNSLGTFFIIGDLEMSATAEAIFEIGNVIENDVTVATGADVLDVNGNAIINGTIRVELIGGFAPELDDSFQLVSVSGGALTVSPGVVFDLATPGPGLAWDTSQFATTGTIIVVEAGIPADDFEAWAASFSLVGADALRGADPDLDGFTNFEEFAFGGNPTEPTGSLTTAASDGGDLVVTFLRRDSGVSYTVTKSTTLSPPWLDADDITYLDPVDQTGVPAGYTRVSFSAPIGGTGFFRVEATEDVPL